MSSYAIREAGSTLDDCSAPYAQGSFAAAKQQHSLLDMSNPVSSRRAFQALSVAGCPQVTSMGVLELLKACSKTLVSLNVSRTGVSMLNLQKWVSAEALISSKGVQRPCQHG
jgi:hypothetical protein